jgi:hypothetical protein
MASSSNIPFALPGFKIDQVDERSDTLVIQRTQHRECCHLSVLRTVIDADPLPLHAVAVRSALQWTPSAIGVGGS